MYNGKQILEYLKNNKLILATAESCTAGKIINLLAKIPKCGKCLEVGYIVYSEESKKRLLGVKQTTIDKFNLTSEEVANEMCKGALTNNQSNVAISTTGIAGRKAIDGIPPGTICFGWGFKKNNKIHIFTKTCHFKGTRSQILKQAAEYSLMKIPFFHQKFKLQHN